ncbi:membrane protein insertase YidC [Nocardioides sp. AX2bis]|uniref:membrane protein insertase YidC n=1 Tax=Nocardioides sp. AX2bis TaxID=2653157 RepID=UPI0012F228F7|nr:membrane protein insertase YidC [Nocardioides sp. AX2bis]VXA91494.1 YidC/Oxa1 family membrane protein insertase [Nocardioides sp. AX2bis]
MEALSDFGNFILTPLYYVISAIMIGFHEFFSLFLDPAGGLAWALSIIGLTVVIRICLIPLFVRQIKSSRNMQLIQPKVVELRKKYGHDRQRMAEETMKLYKDAGTNPFASCLPLLLQMPIFFALFRLLDQAADGTPHGFMTAARAEAFGTSDIFGFVPISDTFWQSRTWGPTPDLSVMLVALVLVLAMTATTFITQRQLMSKNMPADALKGQYAQQQKLLLYVLPVAFGLGGVAFPIGVLLYWTTSNLWTMGQQFYVIRNNPAPGTPAMDAKLDRDRAKAIRKGEVVESEPEVLPVAESRAATRQQPKRQTRQQRQQGSPRPSTGGTSGSQKRPAGQRPSGQRPGGGPKPANKKGKK